MSDEKTPREFWIFKGDSNFCSELDYDVDTDREVKARPDGFYDIVCTADTLEGGIHVREVINEGSVKKTEADDRVAELERQNRIMREALTWYRFEYEDDIAFDALKACEVKGNE